MTILEKLGQFWDNVTLPFELTEVFQAFADIWETIPLVIRLVIIAMFSLACLFVVIKMLF